MDGGAYWNVLIFVLPALLVGLVITLRIRLRMSGRRLRCVDAVASTSVRLEPDTYCDYAFELLRAARLYAAPVMVGNRFLGFFARSEALRRGCRDLAGTYVGSVMIPASQCGCLSSDSALERAGRLLRKSPFPMLPVLDRNQKLLGFITEGSIQQVSPRVR